MPQFPYRFDEFINRLNSNFSDIPRDALDEMEDAIENVVDRIRRELR